jgi:hypothetical protein
MGAVSYRFGVFSKQPIAGITPIESMLEIYEKTDIHPPSRTAVTTSPRAARIDALRGGDGPILPLPKVAQVLAHASDSKNPTPIETPIVVSGFSPQAFQMVKTAFSEAGLNVVVGGSASAGSASSLDRGRRTTVSTNQASVAGGVKAAPIAPGAPIAAVLMRGDMFIAGTGTVTFVEGKRVLGFGHPFFGYGHVAFPMATAAILNTLATPAGSYKQAATGIEVGMIAHDRLTAISGDLGAKAPMIPIEIRVQRADLPRSKGILTRVEVIEHPSWTPSLLQMALANAVTGRLGDEAGGTLDLVARFQVGDRAVELRDSYAAPPPLKAAVFLARDVGAAAAAIASFPLERADIRSVSISVRAKPEPELAFLESLVPESSVVRAGQAVPVVARIRPYMSEPETLHFSIPIPVDARGEVELFAGGAVDIDERDGKVFGERVPSDLDDLLAVLAERRPGRGLYARLYLKRKGLRSNVDLLSSLPPSQMMTLSRPADTQQKGVKQALGPSAEAPSPLVVSGGLTVKLHVVP